MSDKSAIEWTDATWQIASGCSPVSAACRGCYSARLAGTRLKHHPRCQGLTRQAEDGRHVWTGEVRLHPDQLDQPLRWRKGRRIFVGDRTDLFHAAIPDDYIDRVWAVMALTPQHTYQVLTKRPERMRAYVEGIKPSGGTLWDRITEAAMDIGYSVRGYRGSGGLAERPLPNVWLGVSIEDQASADARIPHLLATPAAVRFVSAEPLLGAVDLERWLSIAWQCSYCGGYFSGRHRGTCPDCGKVGGWCGSHAFNGRGRKPNRVFPSQSGRGLDWVIVGGESGPHARPMHPDWARSLRDQCAAAGVPFLFKQWGEWTPGERLDHPRDFPARDGRSAVLSPGNQVMYRVGKSAAGRLLDGVEHNGMPGVTP